MSRMVLMDTGPLVAMLNKRERHHAWAMSLAAQFPPPWHTCESVLSEACFLTKSLPNGPRTVLELVRRQLLSIGLTVEEESERISLLMDRYSNQPMSLADACLVRMSELHDDCVLLTLDSDFRVYRRNGRQAIPLLMPTSSR